jgi:hypothetical protein
LRDVWAWAHPGPRDNTFALISPRNLGGFRVVVEKMMAQFGDVWTMQAMMVMCFLKSKKHATRGFGWCVVFPLQSRSYRVSSQFYPYISENQSHMFGPFNCHFVWFLLGACGFVLASNGALFETKMVV